jgi:hypothetical protein
LGHGLSLVYRKGEQRKGVEGCAFPGLDLCRSIT